MLDMIAIALAPSIALLIFIYQKDRYDREPSRVLFELFSFGFLTTVPVYFIEKFLLFFSQEPLYIAFIVAGFTEELFKFLVVLSIAYKIKAYNEKLDGIIYCVFASLGFATAENILYIVNQRNFVFTAILRGIFAVPGHMLFAITMGYYLSISKFSKIDKTLNLFKALFLSVLLHGIYDYILMSKMYGFFIIFVLFTIYLWKTGLDKLNRYVIDSKENYDEDNI